MKLEEVKLSNIKNFLKWYKRKEDECIFTKKGLWKFQKECWTADLEMYWHYDDQLSDDQVSKIFEDGLEGYDSVYMEIHDNCWDSMWDIKKNFFENLDYDADDLTEKFIEEMMDFYDCEREDVKDCAEDEIFEFINENFGDDVHVDLDMDELLKRTPGAVYIDNDELMDYDTVNMKEVLENASDLLYAPLEFSDHLGDICGDLHEKYLPQRDISYLDEGHEVSASIADSLNDYVDMLAEAQRTDSKLDFVVEVAGKYYPLENTPYLSRESNYSNEGEAIKITEDIQVTEYLENYDAFLKPFKETLDAYMKKYIDDKIAKEDYFSTDKHGRSLVHYTLLYGSADLQLQVYQAIWEAKKEFLFYAPDMLGISPLAICSQMDDEDEYGQVIREFLVRAYATLLNKLPRYGEVTTDWVLASTLEGKENGITYYIIESEETDEVVDLAEYNLDSTMTVFDTENGSFTRMALKSFNILTPIESVLISIDGTVAA